MRSTKPIFSTLPQSLQDLMLDLKTESITAILVGGIVRDFYQTGLWSRDIDLEVRCDDLTLQKFLTESSRVENFEILRFGVCRVFLSGCELEIAPARKETYHTSIAPSGHSDFEVHYLDDKASDKEAFSRRDFTVNAMGLKLDDNNDLMLIDPFNGIGHLEQAILESVHPEFHRDPLRLARAVRFSLQYSLEYSGGLIEMFTRMSLEKISLKLILREALKSHQLRFFSELFILVEDCGVRLSKDLKPLSFLREFKSQKTFNNMNEFWIALCLNSTEEIQYHLNEKEDTLCLAFGLKQKEANKVLRLMHFLRFDFEETMLLIADIESLDEIHKEIKTLIALMKWVDYQEHQGWILKHADDSQIASMQVLIQLYEIYDGQLQKVKLSAPSIPKQWEALALQETIRNYRPLRTN